MVEDKEIDEATKRILERTANINFTRYDVKPSQSGKRKKKDDISKPVEGFDRKDNFLKEIENLEAQDAILKIEQKIGDDFDNVHLWIELGKKLASDKDEDRAIHAFSTALMKEPKNKTALKHLALTYEDLNKWGDAIECWSQILNQDEEDELAIRGYAWCSLKSDDYEEAILHYTKVLTIKPNDVDSNDNLGYVFWKTKKYDDAIKQLEKSLNFERKSGDSYAERFLAFSHNDLGEDKKVWEHYLDEALSKKTKDWNVPFLKGKLAYDDGDFGKATMWFKQSVILEPLYDNLFELGRCYATQEKFELAIFYYNKAESFDKDDIYSLMNMAGCHIDYNKNYESALELTNRVLDVNETVVRALYLKNICYAKQDQPKEIIESVKNFEKINGQSFFHKGSPLEKEEDKQWQTKVINQLVRAYDELERFDKSLECVNVSLELENTPQNQNLKAWTLEGAEKIKEALEICEELILQKTDLWYVYSRKGDLLYENYPERLDEALEAKQKCVEILKKEENSQVELANVYLAMAKIVKDIGGLIDKKDRYVDAKNGEYKLKIEKALEFTELALENDNDLWKAWYEKGNCYWNLEKDDSALECYEKAVSINAKDVNSWMCLGDTTRRLGSVSEAKYFYEKAVQVSNKKVKDKTELISNNVRKGYDWFDAELEFIRCLWSEGKPTEALDEIKKIFEIGKTSDIDVHRIRALAYGKLEKYRDAIDAWEIGMKNFSEDKWFKGICLYNASNDALNAGWQVDADSYAQKLIDSDAEYSTDGYQLQGRYLRKNKEYEKAIIILEEHLADFTQHGKKRALEILISCCDKLENKEKKEEYVKRLKELKEKD